MTQARVTSAALEVVVEADSDARISSMVLEMAHSVQEGAPPPPPPSGRQRAVVMVIG